MSPSPHCPRCQAELPAGAPEGLCPRCLLAAGLPPTSETTPFAPAGAAPSAAELQPFFPQLEIMELLGKGGMGAVYKARQLTLDRVVALKILPRDVVGDPAFAERFMREARALARLNHPHIVTVHDFGHAGPFYYFLMEFVDGVNLRQAMRAGTLGPAEALRVVPQICEALQFAHDEGIVHRDIKPENILLDKRGRVKMADFGLAKLLGSGPGDVTLTGTQQAMGTLHYMAPEQVEGSRALDHRADIYSLGVTFYEMLTGELPLGRFAPPSKKVQIDVRLDEVVLHALEKEPGLRYQHASEIKTDIETIGSKLAPGPAAAALEQLVVDHWPEGKIRTIFVYRERTGAGLAEAKQAVEEIARRRQLPGWDRPVDEKMRWLVGLSFGLLAVVMVSAFWLRLSLIITIPLTLATLVVPNAYRAWKQWGTPEGYRAAWFAALWACITLGGPVFTFLAEPEPVLERLYELTGAEPGPHDPLFFRGVLVLLVVGSLFMMISWLVRQSRERRLRTPAPAAPDTSGPGGDGRPRDVFNILLFDRTAVGRGLRWLFAGLFVMLAVTGALVMGASLWGHQDPDRVVLQAVAFGATVATMMTVSALVLWAVVWAVITVVMEWWKGAAPAGLKLVRTALLLGSVVCFAYFGSARASGGPDWVVLELGSPFVWFRGRLDPEGLSATFLLSWAWGIFAAGQLCLVVWRATFPKTAALVPLDAPAAPPADVALQLHRAGTFLLATGVFIMVSPFLLIPVVVLADQGQRQVGELLQIMTVWSVLAGAVVARGGLNLRQARGYGVATCGAVLAMIPSSPGFVVGFPAGLWALLVLNQRAVRAEFERTAWLDKNAALERAAGAPRGESVASMLGRLTGRALRSRRARLLGWTVFCAGLFFVLSLPGGLLDNFLWPYHGAYECTVSLEPVEPTCRRVVIRELIESRRNGSRNGFSLVHGILPPPDEVARHEFVVTFERFNQNEAKVTVDALDGMSWKYQDNSQQKETGRPLDFVTAHHLMVQGVQIPNGVQAPPEPLPVQARFLLDLVLATAVEPSLMVSPITNGDRSPVGRLDRQALKLMHAQRTVNKKPPFRERSGTEKVSFSPVVPVLAVGGPLMLAVWAGGLWWLWRRQPGSANRG